MRLIDLPRSPYTPLYQLLSKQRRCQPEIKKKANGTIDFINDTAKIEFDANDIFLEIGQLVSLLKQKFRTLKVLCHFEHQISRLDSEAMYSTGLTNQIPRINTALHTEAKIISLKIFPKRIRFRIIDKYRTF
jgi:hypothetical protein